MTNGAIMRMTAVAALLCVVSLAWAQGPGPLYDEIAEAAPTLPKGYDSQDAIRAALDSGELKPMEVPPEMPEGIVAIRDITFGEGSGRPLILDLYMPETRERPAPAIVFIHGGGWRGGNKDGHRFEFYHWASRGYMVAAITYRLRDEAKFPAAARDAKCAVRWVRANAAKYNIDADHIGVIGTSAGAHLSMLVAYASDVPELEGDGGHEEYSSAVQAVVSLYGPADLAMPGARDHERIVNFIGQSFEDAPELYRLASPIRHVTPDDPPTLILHGTVDQNVPIVFADLLAAKLAEAGVPYAYDRQEGWHHGMERVQRVHPRCAYLIDRFFDMHLRPESP
jgi:acetyl esterase/lipase